MGGHYHQILGRRGVRAAWAGEGDFPLSKLQKEEDIGHLGKETKHRREDRK